jgi:hypothetical protein
MEGLKSEPVLVNTKKTKKCSHCAEIMMILLIFGNIHQCRHIKQGEKFQAFWCYQMTQISTNT